MNNFEFSICCDSYWKDISKGFSGLQQDAEFVDMTLAADGHLVKVHQNIVALASPYLKAMLQSASCQHPIIFLNDINKEVLSYILEYIYTGEVKIPTNIVNIFVKSCKALYIRGVDTISIPETINTNEAESLNQRNDKIADNNIAAHIKINTQADNNYELEVVPNQNNIVIENIEHEISYPNIADISNDNHDRMEIDSENIQIFDINNHVGLKSGSFSNMEINKQSANLQKGDKIKILSDVKIFNPRNNTEEESTINLLENPINITLNTENWQINDMPSISCKEIVTTTDTKSNDTFSLDKCKTKQIPSTSTVNIWQPELGQNTLTEPSATTAQDQFVDLIDAEVKQMEKTVNVKKELVLKNLKKISLHMKSQNQVKNIPKMTLNQVDKYQQDQFPHYTISNRGAIQLLFHRFLYHTHHHSHGGIKKRWRCIDYRKLHCPAFIDTENEEIKTQLLEHVHPNHDDIIRKKLKKSIVFTSLTSAVNTINTLVKDESNC